MQRPITEEENGKNRLLFAVPVGNKVYGRARETGYFNKKLFKKSEIALNSVLFPERQLWRRSMDVASTFLRAHLVSRSNFLIET